MSTRDLIDRFYELLAARDFDGLDAILAEDIVVRYHAQPDQLPWAGTFNGRAGFTQFLGLVADHVSIVDAERSAPIVDGDKAVIETHGTWRANATGTEIHGAMLNIFTIRDASISGYEVYADTAAFVAALAG